MMQLGSRYSMQQVFDKSAYDDLTKTKDKQSVSGDVSLGIGPFSASAEYSSETTTDETTKVANSENKEDRTITSLGAPPAEDELTWAQQSSIEAMPIDVIPTDLCSLFSTSGVDESSPNKDIMQEIKTAKLHQKCIKRLSIDGYCKKRVAPRSGFSVCNAIREGRQSHTCTEDSECGPRTSSGPNYECVSGKCVLAYTRIYDIHLAFQTPCSEGENAVCDVEPICALFEKRDVHVLANRIQARDLAKSTNRLRSWWRWTRQALHPPHPPRRLATNHEYIPSSRN